MHLLLTRRPGGSRRSGRDESAERLGPLYLRLLAESPPLRASEEAEAARRIRRLEEAEWAAVFSHPRAIADVRRLLRGSLNGTSPAGLGRLAGLARCGGGGPRASERAAWDEAARETAVRLRELDADRLLLDAAIDLVTTLPNSGRTSRELRRCARSSRYRRYVGAVLQARRATTAARDRFLVRNMRLVVAIARSYVSAHMPLQDLIQEGSIGLLKAVQRFDPERGFRFSTFAVWWIRHAVRRAIADHGRLVHVPVHVAEDRQRTRRAVATFAAGRGREPTDAEAIDEVGLDARDLAAFRRGLPEVVLTLDRPVAEDGGRRHIDMLADEEAPDPLEEVCRAEWRDEARRLVGRLPPVEAQVVRWHYGLDGLDETTLKDVGDRLGRSRERARQLDAQACRRLASSIER